MFLTDYIRVYDDVMSPEICNSIIQRFNANESSMDEFRNSLPPDKGGNVRPCFDVAITRYPEIWTDLTDVILKHLSAGIERYMNDCPGCHFPARYGWEAIRIKRYEPTQDQRFRSHTDTATLESAKRYLGVFIFLNDVESGGETIFPHLHIRIKPKQGRMFLFPPYWMYVHAGVASNIGRRYLMGSYLHLLPGISNESMIVIPEIGE